MNLTMIVLAVMAVMSLIAFAMMGIDKRRARRGKWRIPESRLFLAALLMGGIGATAGMMFFRHKTKHWYFRLFLPLIAAVQIAILIGTLFI